MTNADRFRDAYIEKLTEAVQKHPDEYHYPVAKVPEVVDKMIPSLKKGGANLGPATKAAARTIGIKPTIEGIKRYLQLDDAPCAASMGCLCLHHARGGDVTSPCSATE